MPASIPIDHPSLVLGSVVDHGLLTLVQHIMANQAKYEAAQQKLNSFLLMKRSLAMTINELMDMSVDVADLKNNLAAIDSSIQSAATEYMTTRLQAETDIQQCREQMASLSVTDQLESPLNFSASKLTPFPLASDSLKLDAQYFSHLNESENDVAANIEKYVRDSTSELGGKSTELGRKAAAQVSQQQQHHSLSGTLIITASCTHRNVALYDPLVIDPDKGISSWNHLFPQDQIPIDDHEVMASIATEPSSTANTNLMSILSGAMYGSSFIGMVHFIKSKSAQTNVDDRLISQLKEKLRLGGWLEHVSGGFGVERSVVEDVKKLLSSQSVSSHISLIVTGVLPAISSNEVKLSVNRFAQPDTTKTLSMLSALNSGGESETSSVDSEATTSQKSKQLLQFQNASNANMIKTLSEVDRGSNQVLDTNSLLRAFENYITLIPRENSGVPIGFYVKKISKKQLAKLWINKYFPEPKLDNSSNPSKTPTQR